MRTLIRNAAIATAVGALMAGTALAQAENDLPAVHRSGSVEYLSGGIGQSQSKAIENASRHWPLTLEFAVQDKPHADFAANARVMVRDAHGHTALQATSGGPFLLAKLAPGDYAVTATLAGKTLHEKVLVKGDQPAKALFVWPTGTDGNRS